MRFYLQQKAAVLSWGQFKEGAALMSRSEWFVFPSRRGYRVQSLRISWEKPHPPSQFGGVGVGVRGMKDYQGVELRI